MFVTTLACLNISGDIQRTSLAAAMLVAPEIRRKA
jgi:hypothetical protein